MGKDVIALFSQLNIYD